MGKNNSVKDVKILRMMYDAELKKMLGYIAVVISLLTVLFTLFVMIIGGTITSPFPQLSFLLFSIWVLCCYFTCMLGTKYITIKQLENRLGITKVFYSLSPDWNIFSRILHWFHSDFMGVKKEEYKRLSMMIDLIILFVILSTAIIFITAEMVLIKGI